MLTALTFSLDR